MHPSDSQLPTTAGIGLRAEHWADWLQATPAVGFAEVHSENHFGGGRSWQVLERVRADLPVSLHGVGLSIGSADPLDEAHLARLHALVRRVEPALVSDHLCWSSFGGQHVNDLLPLPYTAEALAHVVERVQQVQERLGRMILLENPSSDVEFAGSEMTEAAFLAEVARRSGCGILLDVNNIYVSACNHGHDARRYLDEIPLGVVREMHLAGFLRRNVGDAQILIDTHSAPVDPAVWALYRAALRRFGATPTLIEWDADLPDLRELVAHAEQADAIAASVAKEHADERIACAA